ncbi:hypothetical protein NDU88_004222 [Pleurodeles waltl]|uniref:Uncharacterized protein n=1 Tax=Pleurodeles waltl TaxID=8319 RepID=A0AAV7NIS0_PLEWA|nr:hypothetical protein NDU88_004222 [Pleurodeles waltl]
MHCQAPKAYVVCYDVLELLECERCRIREKAVNASRDRWLNARLCHREINLYPNKKPIYEVSCNIWAMRIYGTTWVGRILTWFRGDRSEPSYLMFTNERERMCYDGLELLECERCRIREKTVNASGDRWLNARLCRREINLYPNTKRVYEVSCNTIL